MELDLIIAKYGKWLGGIDVEKAISALRGREGQAVERILGIKAEEDSLEELECRRARSLLELYKAELNKLRGLYAELRSRGIAPSDLVSLRARVREVGRLISFYREVLNRCSQQVSLVNDQL